MSDVERIIALAIAATTLLGIVAGWLRWVRPKIRRVTREVVASRDAILGREAVVDSITGREIAPPLPGMGVRMAQNEQQMELLTDAVAKIADSHQRLDGIEKRVAQLEHAAVERVAAKAESVAAWRAIEAVADLAPSDVTDGDAPPPLP